MSAYGIDNKDSSYFEFLIMNNWLILNLYFLFVIFGPPNSRYVLLLITANHDSLKAEYAMLFLSVYSNVKTQKMFLKKGT